MDVDQYFKAMGEQEASDLFLKVGSRPFLRINGKLTPFGKDKLTQEQLAAFASELMGPQRKLLLNAERELNFAFERDGAGRFRANVMWQRGEMALVIRRIRRFVGSFEELNLPAPVLSRLAQESSGLVLMTGPTGCGKSTTSASILGYINHGSPRHIMTLEDPIEFQFEEDQAIINQREIGTDTRSFSEGLKNALRQSPDALFISDIRDIETMEAALLAAEAGQLVLSCVHSTNVMATIERIVAFFPPHQHELIRLRLSMVLKGVISLRLLARADGKGRIPACEVLVLTPTVRELLREGRTDQLPSIMAESGMVGMQTFTQALYDRCRAGLVSPEEALKYAESPEELQLALQEIRSIRDARA